MYPIQGEKQMNQDIYSEGATFLVVCKRCGKIFTVIRNWGGGIRRASKNGLPEENPAKCYCGSRQLELY